jgi:hypothetical protein
MFIVFGSVIIPFINISAKERTALLSTEIAKTMVDEKCSQFLVQRKQAEIQCSTRSKLK